jgi:capsular exopolysaccharide synthesis family protein
VGTPKAPPGRLERLADAVRQRALLFALVALLVPALALVYSLSRESEHEATAALLLGGGGGEARVGARDVSTSRELLNLPAVAALAARALPGMDADEVTDSIEVEDPDGADMLQIRAEADSDDEAVRIAEAYANAYIAFSDQLPGGDPRPAVTLVEPTLAEEASSPAIVRNVLLGLLAGLLLATFITWLLDRVDRRVRSIDELEEIYGLPVLARVPRSRSLAKRERMADAVDTAVGFSEEAEAFRTLRTNLRYFNVDTAMHSILVASPLPGDGKSTVARHLAITMASMGDSVCLVDADLRKRDPGAPPGADGLSLVLAGFDLSAALMEVPIAYDAVSEESRMLVELPNGPLPPNPPELLESARMRWVIGELERRFDVVIFDSPALMTVSDAMTLVPAVSGVLIVSGVEQTRRQAALDLRKQIDLLGGRPLGIVANFATRSRGYDYYGYEGGTARGRSARTSASAGRS